MRSPLLIAGLFAICLPWLGCAAPTLPTPPPAAEVSLVGSEAIVIGTAEPNALVACLNEDSGSGLIETADERGDFEIRIAAQEGDHLTLWQVSGATPGQVLELVVPAENP